MQKETIMANYSQSKLKTYGDCPLKYRFGYIDRIKKQDRISQFVGTVVHATLQEVVEARRQFDKTLDFEQATSIFDRIWHEEWRDDIIIDKDYLTPDDYRKSGLKYLEKFFEIEGCRECWEVVALEKGFTFDVGETGLTMGGYIDRLERKGNSFRVIDYKCSDYVMSQDKADEDLQLGVYELAVRNEFSEAEDVKLEWYILGPGEVIRSSRTPEQLEALTSEIAQAIEEIEGNSEYLPLGTRWCPCEYADECEAEKARRTVKPPEIEEAVDAYASLTEKKKELGGEIKHIEKELEDLKPALEEAYRETGAWTLEGRESALDVKREIKYEFPKKGADERRELDQLVRETGLWDALSDLNRADVKKALKAGSFGDLTSDICALMPEYEHLTFKPHKD
jgi:putative RecB family exonuclease